MFNKDLFESDPQAYALDLWESGWIDSEEMITLLLKHMNDDDVRAALESNKLSPQFEQGQQ